MSPDIEWHVGEDADQETIVKTPPHPRTRWRAVAVALAVGLGIGLGIVYRSIPEPAPRPTPITTPEPTSPQPSSSTPQVVGTIERESLALADGNLADFMDVQDVADSAWRQSQRGFFRRWGTPTNGPLYTIVETGTLSADRLWADVIQFRAGQYFRQTRFYQFKGQRWQRIAPVPEMAFWGAVRLTETPHFVLSFRTQDASLAAELAHRYEAIYVRVCSDLKCRELNAVPVDRKLQIVLQPAVVVPTIDWQNDRLRYTLPSPRLSGLYFSMHQSDQPGQDQSLNPAVIESIVYYIARTDASRLATWPIDTTGQQFLDIIAEWESRRLLGQSGRQIIARPEQLASPDLPDLASLWILPPQFTSQLAERRWTESTALIAFLDEQYGADKVVAFLHTLGQTDSLADTIDRLDLPDHEFEKHWQAWLKQAAMPD